MWQQQDTPSVRYRLDVIPAPYSLTDTFSPTPRTCQRRPTNPPRSADALASGLDRPCPFSRQLASDLQRVGTVVMNATGDFWPPVYTWPGVVSPRNTSWLARRYPVPPSGFRIPNCSCAGAEGSIDTFDTATSPRRGSGRLHCGRSERFGREVMRNPPWTARLRVSHEIEALQEEARQVGTGKPNNGDQESPGPGLPESKR